jgi:hypothetical protein
MRLLLGHFSCSPLVLLLLLLPVLFCRYLALIYNDQLVGTGAITTAIRVETIQRSPHLSSSF